MPTNSFLEQFLAGWQMGQGRRESQRQDQELQMQQQRQAMMAQQQAEEFAIRQEEFAARKKALAAEEAAHKVEAAKQAYEMKSQAASLQGNLPTPTAQEVGIQQAVPDVGPPVEQINVPQPSMDIPSPMEGQPAISMPILTGMQQRRMAEEAQQRKMREALGLKFAETQAAEQAREPYRIAEDARALQRAKAGRTIIGGQVTADPSLESVAQGLSNYEIGLSDLGRMPQGAKAAVFAKAKELNPSFNASLYASRQKLRADFTSGKTANNLDSINTAVDHLNTLAEYTTALKNGNVPYANQVSQAFATQTGSAAATNYRTMATAVESEVASLLKKAGATDQEINSWRANFSATGSPAQLQGSINTVLKIMRGREQALQHRWKTGMGTQEDYPIYGEEQKSILDKLGYSAGTSSKSDEGWQTVAGVRVRKKVR